MENSFLILFCIMMSKRISKSKMATRRHLEKTTFLTIYYRMMCNMSFKGFSSMPMYPILMLFLSFKAGPVSAVGSPSSWLAFGNSQVQLRGRHILSQVVSYF